MIDELKAFLEAKGYSDIFLDNMPEEQRSPEAIGLFCWSHTVADINDGTGTFLVQIQVRRKTRAEAKKKIGLKGFAGVGIFPEVEDTETKYSAAGKK